MCRDCHGEISFATNSNVTHGSVTEFKGEISGGYRENQKVQKLGLKLLVPQFVEAVAKVLDFGLVKYAAHNWMKGLSFEETLASMERHQKALRRGEDFDKDSKLPHVAHIACNAMFLFWFLHGPRNEEYRAKFDDRLFKDVDN